MGHPAQVRSDEHARRAQGLEQTGARDEAQREYFYAALHAVDAARAVPPELPKWGVRLWTNAVELARRAGLPWLAAEIARHLADAELSTKVRAWVGEVLLEGEGTAMIPRSLNYTALERELVRRGFRGPRSPGARAA